MVKPARSAPLKYADKSAGQPAMQAIFLAVKKMMAAYAGGNFIVKTDKPGAYELYYGKEVEQQGRKYAGLCFSSLLIQKGYVGFYFFPVYLDSSLKQKLSPELLKCLKGKTCFHIKKEDPDLIKNIGDALAAGFQYYASRGWKK